VNKAGGATGSKGWGAIAHHAIFAKKYLDLCAELGVDCIGYYSSWLNIKETSRGTELAGLQYRATFEWRSTTEASATNPGSPFERLAVHTYAASRDTSVVSTTSTTTDTPTTSTTKKPKCKNWCKKNNKAGPAFSSQKCASWKCGACPECASDASTTPTTTTTSTTKEPQCRNWCKKNNKAGPAFSSQKCASWKCGACPECATSTP